MKNSDSNPPEWWNKDEGDFTILKCLNNALFLQNKNGELSIKYDRPFYWTVSYSGKSLELSDVEMLEVFNLPGFSGEKSKQKHLKYPNASVYDQEKYVRFENYLILFFFARDLSVLLTDDIKIKIHELLN